MFVYILATILEQNINKVSIAKSHLQIQPKVIYMYICTVYIGTQMVMSI